MIACVTKNQVTPQYIFVFIFFLFFFYLIYASTFSVLRLNFYVGAVFLLSASVFQWYSNVPRVPLFSFFHSFKENAGNTIEFISLSVPLLASLNTQLEIIDHFLPNAFLHCSNFSCEQIKT